VDESRRLRKKLPFIKINELTQNDTKSFVVGPEDFRTTSSISDFQRILQSRVKIIPLLIQEESIVVSTKENGQTINHPPISNHGNPKQEKSTKERMVERLTIPKPQETTPQTIHTNSHSERR
jgi:hypothetical protein